MRPATQKIARFGLLTALALVLGLLDRAVPVSAILGGFVPGIKLGLANTVLLYAVYLMDWRSCILLMLTKVVLSGFLFGSLTAILYSLSGGVLSLLVMLLIRRYPGRGALAAALLALAADTWMLIRIPRPAGQRFRRARPIQGIYEPRQGRKHNRPGKGPWRHGPLPPQDKGTAHAFHRTGTARSGTKRSFSGSSTSEIRCRHPGTT